MSSRKVKPCSHNNISVEGISHAAVEAGFSRTPLQKRLAATTASAQLTDRNFTISEEAMSDDWTFPGPLVTPYDALALNPKDPAQSLRSWLRLNEETPVTSRRKTIYVVPSPKMTKEVETLMQNWEKPELPEDSTFPIPDISPPKIDDLCDYLRAFYHKMDIKTFDNEFRWQPWTSRSRTTSTGYVGLATPRGQLVGVRYRPALDGRARKQLNLSDILDALLDCVPSDAYAVAMLLDQDLFEDEEDDFCCGRAVGNSRVAVVSSFRYHPMLDDYSEVDLEHMWPASHCKIYLDKMCDQIKRPTKRARRAETSNHALLDSPLGAAIQASKLTLKPRTREEFEGLWFSRTARTLSHEVGHCFRLGHCVYYACVMQGTASIAEDVRQPPYLCPVCLTKLSTALSRRGATLNLQRTYLKERYEALSHFCEKWKHIGMFSGWHAFVDKRLAQA